ncbi:MAG: hypothetical protein JXB33_02615 [Clostridia bacterium]|nr:hypothetical protein [Clostridia bacterium]
MGFINKRGYGDKERLVCLLAFLIESVIIAACYFLLASSWSDTVYMSVALAMIFTGACMLVMITGGFLVCMFFMQLTVEKKILIMTGLTAAGLGILGFSPAVFDGRISLLDSVYKSFQLFVGEFGDTAFEPGGFPLLLNIARFLALFVTFGTIIAIILKQNILRLNIRLFYRDIVIISDTYDGYAADLANEFTGSGRRTVIGCTSTDDSGSLIYGGKIPLVAIDLNRTLLTDLRTCNIRKAKIIYLLCAQTSDNIRLVKAIRTILGDGKTMASPHPVKPGGGVDSVDLSSGEMIRKYIGLASGLADAQNKSEEKSIPGQTICYISYGSDGEKEFYSLDDVFLERTGRLTTYFINTHEICIKQMLAEYSLADTLEITGGTTSHDLIEKLNDAGIAVAGSGPLLGHVIPEIARNCVFNLITPMKILNLVRHSSDEIPVSWHSMRNIVKISSVALRDFKSRDIRLNLLFIASDNANEIRLMLHDIYQFDVQRNIREILILADTGPAEYLILDRYIESIARDNSLPRIKLKRTKDLLITIDYFYKKYGPASEDVHTAYKKAMSGNNLRNFSKLPEIFIESCLLSSIHISHINEIAQLAIKAFGAEETNRIHEILMYLAATEHARWFNERSLKGCIHSEEQDHLHDRNPNLLPWEMLSDGQKEANVRYVMSSLIALRNK